MANKYLISKKTLNKIADAIRNKLGDDSPIKAEDFVTAIKAIPQERKGQDNDMYISKDVAKRYFIDIQNYTQVQGD